MGQIRKNAQQIQNELDEIHRLWTTGATDDYIIKTRNMDRRQFYRYKSKLCEQIEEIWRAKREADFNAEIQICKERLTNDRARAEIMATETKNPFWAQLSAELAVSILKLEYEGIAGLKNGRFKQLEEKAGYIELKPATTDVPASSVSASGESERTNDEAQF